MSMKIVVHEGLSVDYLVPDTPEGRAALDRHRPMSVNAFFAPFVVTLLIVVLGFSALAVCLVMWINSLALTDLTLHSTFDAAWVPQVVGSTMIGSLLGLAAWTIILQGISAWKDRALLADDSPIVRMPGTISAETLARAPRVDGHDPVLYLYAAIRADAVDTGVRRVKRALEEKRATDAARRRLRARAAQETSETFRRRTIEDVLRDLETPGTAMPRSDS